MTARIVDTAVTGGRIGARPVTVLIDAGRIVEVLHAGAATPAARTPAIDVGGAALLPGLHDHHVHLRAAAAARASVVAGPPDVPDRATLRAALRGAPAAAGGWVRAVGYHESVAGDLDRPGLDALVADRPVRLQHRSGVLWVLNSAGLAAVGLSDTDMPARGDTGGAEPGGVERDGAGRLTGRLWRCDGWLGSRLPHDAGDAGRLLAAVAREGARRGVTGFTDATPGRSQDETDALVEAQRCGRVGQRLHLMSPSAVTLPPGAPAEVTLGPVKVLLDDDRLPSIGELAGEIGAAHAAGRPVAIHCVTQLQAVVALAAWGEAGAQPGDRMEHGAVLDGVQLVEVRRLGLTVVTQPGFVETRGDRYLLDVDERDLPGLWRLRSLLAASIPTAAGSDAPYGPADPWIGVRAAMSRRTSGGATLGGAEGVDEATAVALWTGGAAEPGGRRRRLSAGQPADLCAVVASPTGQPGAPPSVVLTIAGGRVLHDATGAGQGVMDGDE